VPRRLRLTTALVPLALVGALGACANAATAPAGPARAAAAWRGDTLRLPFGATARLAGGASVAFVAVGADSRCPLDALCVAAGDASITVRTAGGAGERALHTDPRLAADTLTAGGTRLRLFGLVPYPSAPAPRPADAEYVALFVAERR
jgi:hypothetical protein